MYVYTKINIIIIKMGFVKEKKFFYFKKFCAAKTPNALIQLVQYEQNLSVTSFPEGIYSIL